MLSSIVTIIKAMWWAGPKLEQDQHNRVDMEHILVYEQPKDMQTANEELRGYLTEAEGKTGYLARKSHLTLILDNLT